MSRIDADSQKADGSGAQTKRERSRARRQERLERERATAWRATMGRRMGFLAGGIVLVAALLGLAQLLSGGAAPEVADDSRPAEIAGDASDLPPYGSGAQDPAPGLPAPDVTGTDFGGNEVVIGAAGEPQALLFLAHWCPHCQRELPEVVDFVEGGRVPEGVGMVAISTGHDERRPNWPPQDWLKRENWQGPVLVDGDNTVATAYGLTATPFWVFVDGEGNVAQRAAGELRMDQLEAMLRDLAA